MFDGPHNHIWLEHHTGAPTVGGIIHGAVLVFSVISDVPDMHTDELVGLGTPKNAGLERAREHLWEERQNIDVQSAHHSIHSANHLSVR